MQTVLPALPNYFCCRFRPRWTYRFYGGDTSGLKFCRHRTKKICQKKTSSSILLVSFVPESPLQRRFSFYPIHAQNVLSSVIGNNLLPWGKGKVRDRKRLEGKHSVTYFVGLEAKEHWCEFNWNLDKRKPRQSIVTLSH